jgi:hypothetical protein
MSEWIPGPKRPEDEPVPKAPEPVRPDPMDLPPDVPKSPSGRVPQWVLDEAAGRPSEPVPFRAWQSDAFGAPSPAAKRRGRWKGVAAVAVVGAMIAGLAIWANQPPARDDIVAFPGDVPTSAPPDPGASVKPAPSTSFPTEGVGETPRPAGLPLGDLSVAAAKGYRFAGLQKDKKSGIAWSPCRPIPWVVRAAARAPEDGQKMLTDAFDRLEEVTGLDFVYEGRTAEKYSDERKPFQPKKYGDRWAPVLVSWSTTKEDPGLKGDVLGRAGAYWVDTASGDRMYASGTVSLDVVELAKVRSLAGYEVTRSIVLHELGHLAGLGHVKSKAALMYPRVSLDVTDYAAADLRGLSVLGQGACQPDG